MSKKKGALIPQVQVVAFAAKGECIAKTPDGEAVLLQNGVPGDIVTAKLLRRRKGMWTAALESVDRPSADRIDPHCLHFDDCGGCKWQHIDYRAQMKHKVAQLDNALERIAKWQPEKRLPDCSAEKIYHYRNKIEFSFSKHAWVSKAVAASQEDLGTKPAGALGLHPPKFFNKVVDLQKCYLADPLNDAIRNFIRSYAFANQLSFFDPVAHEGWLRSMILRQNVKGEWMFILVLFFEAEDKRTAILDSIQQKFPQITSIYYCINQKKNDSLFDQEMLHYWGDLFLEESLDGVRYHIGPKSFFQTNTYQARSLYRRIKEACQLSGNETVYDMYTGVGSIALYIADQCKKVVGVEENAEAIQFANHNMKLNGFDHLAFYVGDVKEVFTDQLVAAHGPADVLIVDPPRSGLHKDVCATILRFAPKRIVYVSCNPATQARDLALLQPGYNFESAQAVDMFPQTNHIESIAILNRRDDH